MSDTPLRRDVLKGIAGSSLALGISSGVAGADGPQAQVVEAGIRYEVPHVENHSKVSLHSRPPYTVDAGGGRLLLDHASTKYESEIVENQALVAEHSSPGERPEVARSGKSVQILPTELSARMRAKHGVGLTSPHRLPNVVIHWNANAPAANIQGVGRVDLEPGSSNEVELDPVEVDVKTVTITDELPDRDDVPDRFLARKKEYGSETVEATPVVEFTHHGVLTVVRATPAPENMEPEIEVNDQ